VVSQNYFVHSNQQQNYLVQQNPQNPMNHGVGIQSNGHYNGMTNGMTNGMSNGMGNTMSNRMGSAMPNNGMNNGMANVVANGTANIYQMHWVSKVIEGPNDSLKFMKSIYWKYEYFWEREKEGENIYFECVSVHNFYGVQSDGVPLWSALKKYCIPFVVFIWRHLVFCVRYISMSFICMLSVWFISFFVWHNVCCCGVNNIAAWMVVYPPRLNIQAADKNFWLRWCSYHGIGLSAWLYFRIFQAFIFCDCVLHHQYFMTVLFLFSRLFSSKISVAVLCLMMVLVHGDGALLIICSLFCFCVVFAYHINPRTSFKSTSC